MHEKRVKERKLEYWQTMQEMIEKLQELQNKVHKFFCLFISDSNIKPF